MAKQIGFDLPCPTCGEKGSLTIDPNALSDDDNVTCGECSSEVAFGTIRETLKTWSRWFQFVDAAFAQPNTAIKAAR